MIRDHQQFELFNRKVFEKAIVKPPFRLIAAMPNEACFYYILSGCTTVVTATERVAIPQADGLVLQCGNYLCEFLVDQEVEYCEAIAIHLYPEVLKTIYDKELPNFLLEVDKIQPVPYQKIPSSTLLKNYIDSLLFYFDHPELVSDELLKIKLKELILLLAKTDNAKIIQSLLDRLFSRSAIDFKAVIEANLYNNYSLEELAALSCLSLSSFKREFVKHYSTSPAKYIRGRKLEKAVQLLKGTSLRISDIAFDCGFTDLAHFSKLFQKVYGLAPSTFRTENTSGHELK